MRQTFKDSSAKEMRMKGKFEAALTAKEAADKELQATRKQVQDKGQESEKLRILLRESNDIRATALCLLKDAVIKFHNEVYKMSV